MSLRGFLCICLGCACAGAARAQEVVDDRERTESSTAVLNVEDLFDRNLIPASAGNVAGPGCLADDCEVAPLPGRGEPLPERREPFPTPAPTPSVTQPAPQATTAQFATLASRSRSPAMIGDFFGPVGGLQPIALRPTVAVAVRDSIDRLTVTDGFGQLSFLQAPGSDGNVALETVQVGDQYVGLVARGNPSAGSPLQPGSYTAIPTGETVDGHQQYVIVGEVNPVVPSVLSGSFNFGQTKYADAGVVLPVDRVLFSYSYFDNVPLALGGRNVHLYDPGFEKTFFNGLASVEMRFPFATTLDNQFTAFDGATSDEVQFGNVRVTPKVLLASAPRAALGAGMGITVPTADDIAFDVFGAEYLRIENESVHLAPWIGGVYTPNDRVFTQVFLQFDFDTNGSPVLVNQDPFNATARPTGFQQVGRLQDPTFMYFDWQVGYWLRNRPTGVASSLTGLAAIAEFHLNRSLQPTDAIVTDFNGIPANIGSELDTLETINVTLGLMAEFHRRTYVSAGYAMPVGGGNDQVFDGELRVLFTHRFGPGTGLRPPVF